MGNKNVISNDGKYLVSNSGSFVVSIQAWFETIKIRIVKTAEYITHRLTDQEWIF